MSGLLRQNTPLSNKENERSRLHICLKKKMREVNWHIFLVKKMRKVYKKPTFQLL